MIVSPINPSLVSSVSLPTPNQQAETELGRLATICSVQSISLLVLVLGTGRKYLYTASWLPLDAAPHSTQWNGRCPSSEPIYCHCTPYWTSLWYSWPRSPLTMKGDLGQHGPARRKYSFSKLHLSRFPESFSLRVSWFWCHRSLLLHQHWLCGGPPTYLLRFPLFHPLQWDG